MDERHMEDGQREDCCNAHRSTAASAHCEIKKYCKGDSHEIAFCNGRN